MPLASFWECWLWSFRYLEHWARACPSWMQHATMLALHAQMRKRRCLVTFSVGTSGGIWGESSLVVALANLRLGGQSLPKLSSLKVAGTDAACNSATLDCRQPGNSIEMYCSNGTLGIDSKLKTSIRLVAASQIWASACQTLGIIFVYLVVFGWAACVLGIVGASLACCVCCQCCKAKLDDPTVKQGAPPVVVGTAAPA